MSAEVARAEAHERRDWVNMTLQSNLRKAPFRFEVCTGTQRRPKIPTQ